MAFISEAWAGVAQASASYHARRIVRSLGLGTEDVADVRQELLLKVVRRAQGFDPARAAWVTFIDVIIRHAADDLTERLARERRVIAGRLEDLSIERKGLGVPLTEVLSANDDLSAMWAGAIDPFAEVDRRIDIERFIGRLPDGLRRLCRLFQTEPTADAQRLSGLSKSEFYRQLEDLAMRLRAAGLAEGDPVGKITPSTGT